MSGNQMILLGGSQAPAVDPFFYSVTSLLHGDGTNGGQNNTFLDSSTNNFTITRNGNTTQGSFSPFSQTGWSNYFDGSGDFLTVPSNSAFQFGTGEFTIECWINKPAAANGPIVDARGSATASPYAFYVDANNFPYFYDGSVYTSAVAIANNQWNHIVVVRTSGVLKMFVNGVQGYSAAYTTALNPSGTVYLGGQDFGASASYTAGYISNLRIVKGTAVYTANFTPSTTPLTAISGTSLLTCQSNRFLDNSSNAFAITRNGDVSVQPFSPFNPITPYSTSSIGGSGYFDGSGDYLDIADSTALDLNTTFTVEGWFYQTVAGTAGFFARGGGAASWSTTNGHEYQAFVFSGLFYWQFNSSGSPISITGTAPPANSWHHFAVGYNGTTTRVWLDGVSIGTSTSGYTLPTTRNITRVGFLASNEGPLTGYVSGLRVVKGTDVYGVSNTSITVPTAPPTAITNTSLLLNFTNGAIFDNAAVADYETVGNAQISTSVKKYGTGSMAFDGTGDYLLTRDSPNLTLGAGDFTVEAWVYPTASPIQPIIAAQWDGVGGGTGLSWVLLLSNDSNRYLRFALSTNGSGVLTDSVSSTALALNAWNHVALVRCGSVFIAYLNGTSVVRYTISAGTALYDATNQVSVGSSSTGTQNFNGYIDDLRISKGICRYPYNFTPPTAEFPNIGGTVTLTADPYFDYTTLLLPGNGTNGAQNNTFLDSSTNNFTITRNGNTTQGTFSPFSQTGWGNYFDGTGDFLTTNATQAIPATGDFTIEAWVYPTVSGPGRNIVSQGTAGTSGRLQLNVHTDNTLQFAITSTIVYSSGQVAPNQWNYVAVTRTGSSVAFYINGSAAGTATLSGTVQNTTLSIGAEWSGDPYRWLGYISNVRISNVVRTITAAPTAPFTSDANTVVLTCQANRFIDASSNAYTITRNGDVSVQAFSPFNPTASWSAATYGGSGYFDGSGDYLDFPTSSAFTMGTGDFTIELWYYPSVNYVSGNGYLFDLGSNGTRVQLFNNQIYFVPVAGSGVTGSAGVGVLAGTWYHIACVRSGSTITVYLNGTSIGSVSNSSNLTDNDCRIGEWGGGTAGPFNGYISNLRIVKGTAVYTAAFTPPTAPLTAITNTSLLTNYTNAGIYDATSKNDLETVGNAQISTTQSKFGGSSMLFDGTGDWLRAPASPNLDMGTGDLTIEGWFYLTATVAVDYRMIVSDATNGNNYVAIRSGGTGGQLEVNVNGTSFRLNLNNTVTINTWFHLAVVRYNGTWNGFVNGASLGTSAAAAAFNLGNGGTFVGRFGGATAYEWPGYIDDLRITKGIARYTSNFTPPTTAFLTL